jgi:NarL family two-component system response regulator LiaR
MSERQITVLLVDDHALVRQGVRAFLETQPDIKVIGEADSGRAAVEIASAHAPDVALVDLLMPEMDGVETTRLLSACAPRTRVIVLTSYSEDEHIFPAIRAGAVSYILKNVAAHELADAVRKTAGGASVLLPHVAARVVQELHGRRGEAVNPFRELSDRELEVLRLLAMGHSNTEIAAALSISEHTVKSHVGNILEKLQLTDRTQAAVYAWRHGIVRRE